MNRQLRGKKWIESTTKYEDDNTLKITLVTLANTSTKTMISATINYANDNIAEALKACRKMNIYKVIATLAECGKVWDGMDESNYVGKGFTLPCDGVIEKYVLYRDGSQKLISTTNFESKVDGENKLTVTCEDTRHINDRDEKIITHTTVETKLPAYAYEENKEEHEEQVENVTSEISIVQAPATTKKFTTHTGKKVTGTLIEQWDNGEHSAAKLYDMGNNKELLLAIYTRLSTMVSADIILDKQLNAILKLMKHPEKICDTQIEKIIVRYYEKGEKDTSILRMEINDQEIHYKWSGNLKVDMYTTEAWDKNSEYIFYNRKRVMFTAWNLRKAYLKQGKNIPLSLCIKYAVGQERFYQGIYSSFEEATKEPSKPILDILHQKSESVTTPEKRQERTIKYSIPYRLFKSSEKGGLYELITYFDGAIEETDRNYNKSTKEMEFTFKITSDSYKEARRFGYDEDTFDNVVSSTKICFLNHYKEELKHHGMELTNHLLTNDTESRKEYADHKLETGKITKETYEWFMSFHDGLLIPVLN